MSRQLFGLEKGVRIFSENGDSGIDILRGTGAPGGTTDTDGANVGSVYQEDAGLGFYLKTAAGSGTDKWSRLAKTDELNAIAFQSCINAATGDAAPVSGSTIDLGASPFSDDDAPTMVATDFAVDDLILFGVGGTPKLMKVSVVSAPNITVVDSDRPLTTSDNYVVKNYLPDSPNAQELQALVHYNGTAIIKIGDVNWDFATGINLSSGYASQNGTISSADTVESAIEKLDGNQQDIQTLQGVAQGSTDLGTFTGTTIPDNVAIKPALQALETAIEAAQATGKVTGVTALQDIDTVLVDNFHSVEWEVVAWEQATPANKKFFKVTALHDGTAAADAVNVDDSNHTKLKLGANFNLVTAVDLNGAGAAQTMRLRCSSSTAGVTIEFRRNGVPVQ